MIFHVLCLKQRFVRKSEKHVFNESTDNSIVDSTCVNYLWWIRLWQVLVKKWNILLHIIAVLFTVVGTWPQLSRLPVQLTEFGTNINLCHDMFTYLYHNQTETGIKLFSHKKCHVTFGFEYTTRVDKKFSAQHTSGDTAHAHSIRWI